MTRIVTMAPRIPSPHRLEMESEDNEISPRKGFSSVSLDYERGERDESNDA